MAHTVRPSRVGAALAITMGIVYTLSALIVAMWPESGMGGLNSLFSNALPTGSVVDTSSVGFNAGVFFTGLIASMVMPFIVGALFGSLYNWFNHRDEVSAASTPSTNRTTTSTTSTTRPLTT